MGATAWSALAGRQRVPARSVQPWEQCAGQRQGHTVCRSYPPLLPVTLSPMWDPLPRARSVHQPHWPSHRYAIDGAATAFPQAIGLGATWNSTLLWAIGDVVSTEAVAKRNDHRRLGELDWPFYLSCWAPVINIARDTRWGRTAETYGEDPMLTRVLALQMVQVGVTPNTSQLALSRLVTLIITAL